MSKQRGDYKVVPYPKLRQVLSMMMNNLSITLSFDHDIIDGAPAARFTQRFKELIESGYGLGDETDRE